MYTCSTKISTESSEEFDRKISIEKKKRVLMEESRSGSVAQSQETSMFATEDEENALSETRVSGNVAGKTIILIHDVIDTGRLLKTAVEALKTAGATCIYVLATHGVFSAEALAIIVSLDPKFVKSVHVTNSIPQNISKAILKERLGIIDVSALIAEIIRRHHYCESVSIVGGEFKPNEFKSEWVHIDDHHGKPMGIKVDNTSLGQLGVHISQSNEVSQRSDEDSNSASNRPLQRVRKGYRLSSKCWD